MKATNLYIKYKGEGDKLVKLTIANSKAAIYKLEEYNKAIFFNKKLEFSVHKLRGIMMISSIKQYLTKIKFFRIYNTTIDIYQFMDKYI